MATGQIECVLRQIRRIVRPRESGALCDAQLVERFASHRDEAAFEALLHRHGAMVHGVCRRVLHRTHDIEDAFQATFLVLARHAGAIRKRASIGSWLYGVAYRVAVKARGKAARRSRREAQAPPPCQPDTLAEIACRELRMLVDEELSRLPEKCRISFILCCLEGKTHDQAAREVGWPSGSMSRWLARSRELLRDRLAKRGITLSGGAILAALGEQAARSAVPPALIDSTLRVTQSWAAAGTLAGHTISSTTAMLAEAATRSLVLSKWARAARVALAAGILGLGIGLLAAKSGVDAKPQIKKAAGARQLEGQGGKKSAGPETGHPLDKVKKLLLHRFGGNEQSEAAVESGLRWLANHQAKDGHWSLEGFEKDARCACKDHSGYRNDIAGTAFGLLPMVGAGHTHRAAIKSPYTKNVEAGLKYLTAKLDKKTGDLGGGMYAQGLATMAMCEAYALTRDPLLKASAQKAVDYLVKAQHQAGGWRYGPGQPGDTSVTVWQVQALLSAQASDLTVPHHALDRVRGFLDSCASATDHGYSYTPGAPSTPAMTAAALLCRESIQGWGPGNARLKMGVAGVLMNRLPETDKNMYFHYLATKTMHLAGGDGWKRWNEKMRPFLVREQDQGKTIIHQKGSWSPQGDPFAAAGGRLMATSLSLLTLEAYYRSDLVLAARPALALKAADLDEIWKSLGEGNAMKARQGVWRLAKAPKEAAPFLNKQLQSARHGVDSKTIERLVAELDSDRFAVRRKAAADLEKLGEAAEAALKKAAGKGSSVEVVRRATKILDKLDRKAAAKRLRDRRALDALELMDTPDARAVLTHLAKGEEGAWLTEQARHTLQRLSN